MKSTNHEINVLIYNNINAVCEKFSLQLKQVYKNIHSIVHKINVDIDQIAIFEISKIF